MAAQLLESSLLIGYVMKLLIIIRALLVCLSLKKCADMYGVDEKWSFLQHRALALTTGEY
jgi:hypothetical protein